MMGYFRLKKSFQVVSVFAFSFSACHLFNHSEEKVVITICNRNITKTELDRDIEKNYK